jgi:hypothetical protein
MGLSILFAHTRWNHPPTLAFPIGKVTIMINDNVAGFSSCFGSNNTLRRNDFSGKGSLVLKGVDRDGRLVPVWLGLEEILLSSDRRAGVVGKKRSE